ncbi:2OG-Fe(II) oxygenase [Pleionea sp. CnH1-48]|uniref:2OG-Fe(II) oxygenase n=1 Tax=Pleionea sp. CnH1-48 TaxID=2954494 RepID=UPI00209739D5|nr:2OG-Fe(II) oxygenase [Pleionea sp. CnH1-48]MCO7227139.1 2OG-Fe(II) oxygenase [Pleionea sp. CnH1-48]
MNLDRNGPYIFTIDDIFSQEECNHHIDFIESNNPTMAPVLTAYGEKYKSSIRNNERILKQDQKLAKSIYQSIKDKLPAEIHGASICGINELFRYYRYKPGMRFAPHPDAAFIRNPKERSYYTFLIYLNEVEKGGETSFCVEPEVSFAPKRGMGLLFQHPIIHEGKEVYSGTKYIIRTDVMYRLNEEGNGKRLDS